jgi:hypothetical protein
MKAAVVTGVSSGIGQAIALRLGRSGYHVFGSVRRPADAARLAQQLGDAFTPLIFDVCDAEAVGSGAEQVRTALGGQRLAALVNNAGVALGGPLMHQPIDEFRKQLEINVTGQLIVTQAFAPLLGADAQLAGSPGRIVMMSSDSGQHGAPFVGAYCASKHAVEGMAESLRRELMLFGIDVVIVGPGFVATPIWDKAEQADTSAYEHTDFAPAMLRFQQYMLEEGRKGYPPERVAEAVLKALSSSKPAARYAVVKGWLENYVLPAVLPRRMIDGILAKQLGLLPAARP